MVGWAGVGCIPIVGFIGADKQSCNPTIFLKKIWTFKIFNFKNKPSQKLNTKILKRFVFQNVWICIKLWECSILKFKINLKLNLILKINLPKN